jgi:hypothetical protein
MDLPPTALQLYNAGMDPRPHSADSEPGEGSTGPELIEVDDRPWWDPDHIVFYAMDDQTIRRRMAFAMAYIEDRERSVQQQITKLKQNAMEAEGQAAEAAGAVDVQDVRALVEYRLTGQGDLTFESDSSVTVAVQSTISTFSSDSVVNRPHSAASRPEVCPEVYVQVQASIKHSEVKVDEPSDEIDQIPTSS